MTALDEAFVTRASRRRVLPFVPAAFGLLVVLTAAGGLAGGHWRVALAAACFELAMGVVAWCLLRTTVRFDRQLPLARVRLDAIRLRRQTAWQFDVALVALSPVLTGVLAWWRGLSLLTSVGVVIAAPVILGLLLIPQALPRRHPASVAACCRTADAPVVAAWEAAGRPASDPYVDAREVSGYRSAPAGGSVDAWHQRATTNRWVAGVRGLLWAAVACVLALAVAALVLALRTAHSLVLLIPVLLLCFAAWRLARKGRTLLRAEPADALEQRKESLAAWCEPSWVPLACLVAAAVLLGIGAATASGGPLSAVVGPVVVLVGAPLVVPQALATHRVSPRPDKAA